MKIINKYQCEICKYRDGPICTNEDVSKFGYGAKPSCKLYVRFHRSRYSKGRRRKDDGQY